AEVGLRIAGALGRFWEVRGYLSEGREQLAEILALPPPTTMQAPQSQSQLRQSFRAKAFHGAGNLTHGQGDYATARSLFEESLSITRELGDKRGIASLLSDLGNVAR